MIKWKQAQDHFPEFGLDYHNPDFVRYAEAYGATGHRVSSAAELKPTLEKALSEGGVQFVE
jgi:acetolactate synthase-1/2/3 large subunit